MTMTYIYTAGESESEPMHIQEHTRSGIALRAALCGVDRKFDRAINPPITLGKGVCQECARLTKEEGERPSALQRRQTTLADVLAHDAET